MRRVPLPRLVLTVATGALLTACGLVLGFDDITMVQAPTSINGRIDGLEGEGAVVHIRVNGGDEVVRPNGPFVVEHALMPGTAFRIEAQSDGHLCSVDPSEGPIAPDRDLQANVHCVSQNARLGALSFIDGQLAPPFDPRVARYALAAPLLRYLDGIDGTARPESPSATLAVGPGFVPAAVGAAVPLSILRDSVTIRARAAAGTTSETVVDRVLHATLFKTSPYVEGAGLGTAVAVSGDVIVAGAPGEDRGDKGGACHVYRRVNGAWSEEAVLHPSAFGPGSDYGATVAVRGDVIAVGAWTAQSIPDGGNYGRGAAFVYRHDASGWKEEALLTVAGGGLLGRAVALADDLLAVSAPAENDSAGAVYIYRHSGGAWNVEGHVTPGATAMSDTQFGTALAITSDRLVVGAPLENSQIGSVHTFARAGSVWSFEQRLLAPANPGARQLRFGAALAIDGDTLVVGAPYDSSESAVVDGDAAPGPQGTWSGAVHVYGHVGGVWTPQVYVKAANPQFGAEFGSSIALTKDTLVVGAPSEKSVATGVDSKPTSEGDRIGAAYVFRKNGAWSQRAYVKAPIVHNVDQFGSSVATDGTALVVGVPYEQGTTPGITIDPDASAPPGKYSGAAYVY